MSFRGFRDNSNTDTSDSDSANNSDSGSQENLTKLFQLSLNISENINSSLNSDNTLINNIIINTNMAPPVLKKEYLDMVPEFRGETELLPRFIQICEKLVLKFYNRENEADFENEYLMSSLLAKIKGQAAINISCCTITSWNELKIALINAYSDKRDVYTLGIEITELKQNHNESPFDYYNKIQKLLNLQISYISTHFPHEARSLTQYCRNYALRVLLRGLREPVGSLMRTKNPQDLNTALNMLTNDFQLETRPRLDKNVTNNTKFNQKPFANIPQRPITYPQQYQRPNLQLPSTSRMPFNPNRNPTNPNYNPNFQNRNVFRPTGNQNYPKPTPMSISTRNTYQRPPVQQNQNYNFKQNQPKFTSEELFNIEEKQSLEPQTCYDNFDPTSESVEMYHDQNDPVAEIPDNFDENNFLEEAASDPTLSY